MTAGEGDGSDRIRRAVRAAVAAGAAVTAGAAWLAAREVDPFGVWLYHFAWLGTLTALAGGLAWRTGRSPMAPALALSLFFWSAPLWYLFELVNLRLANWYYVFVPPDRPVRWLGTWLAFTTVLPALNLAYRWALELGSGTRADPAATGAPAGRSGSPAPDADRLFRVGPGVRLGTGAAGVAFAGLALWRPDTFFPLVWGAVTLLLEPWNQARDPESSLLEDVARGRWGRIGALLAGGLFIGGLWELFNSVAAARWIYTVPGLEDGKLFEMPLPGFLGFPVLALDGYVAYRALEGLGVAVRGWGSRGPEGAPLDRPLRAAVAAAAALLCCAAVQSRVDRWTVDSVRPALEDVPGVDAASARRLRAAGVDGLAGLAALDSAALVSVGLEPAAAGSAARGAALVRLRGMGAANAAALRAAGIGSVCELARAPELRVSRAVAAARRSPRAGDPARVRVWLRAARARCEGSGPPV